MKKEEPLSSASGVPKGAKRVVIHRHDDPVQRWAHDPGSAELRKVGKPQVLPHVLFGSLWTRMDGWTVIAETNELVSAIPTLSVIRTSSLERNPECPLSATS